MSRLRKYKTEEEQIEAAKLRSKIWYHKNKEKAVKRSKDWAKNNLEKRKKYEKIYISKNKNKKKFYDKLYNDKHRVKKIKQSKDYRINNPNCMIEWRNKNKELIKNYSKTYYKNNSKKLIEKQKQLAKDNPNKIKERYNKWLTKNPYYRKEYNRKNRKTQNEKQRFKLLNNPLFKVTRIIRRSITRCFKNNGFKKNSKTAIILGCTYEFYLKHIESQWFLPNNLDMNGKVWMNWQNYGKYNGEFNYGWDIDHITPLASDKSYNGIIRLNHYTNLQPLCSKVNREIKKNKIRE